VIFWEPENRTICWEPENTQCANVSMSQYANVPMSQTHNTAPRTESDAPSRTFWVVSGHRAVTILYARTKQVVPTASVHLHAAEASIVRAYKAAACTCTRQKQALYARIKPKG
jgi:hypothetical protein